MLRREIPAKGEAPLWNRILNLVSSYDAGSNYDEAPEIVTQSGIADALDVSRAHATLELNRMLSGNLVEAHTRHVPGKQKRLLTYTVTPKGREAMIHGKPLNKPTLEDNLRKYGVIVDPDDVITLKSMLEAAEARGRNKRGESNSAYTILIAGAAALAVIGVIYAASRPPGGM